MTFSASSTTDRNTARFLLGDTSNDVATELLTDAQIDAVITLHGYNGGVAFLATGLASRFAQKPTDVSLPGGLRVAWAKRIDRWVELAADMRAGGVTGTYAAFSRTPTRTDGYSELQDEVDAA
jgi:hypothetical protein